jgi:hypothetical protein
VHTTAATPISSEGTLLGWYANEPREALVDFGDGAPLRVPAEAIVGVTEGQAACGRTRE